MENKCKSVEETAMALTVGDVRVTFKATYLGENIQNVLYVGAVEPTDADVIAAVTDPDFPPVLAEGLRASILELGICRLCNTAVEYRTISLEMLYTPFRIFDYTIYEAGQVGAAADDRMPSFVALGLKKVRANKNVKSGSLRLCGVSEANITGNTFATVAVGGVTDAQLSGALSVLNTNIELPSFGIHGQVEMRIMIPKSNFIGLDEKGNRVYQLDGLEEFNGFSFQGVTTQNSRKPKK